MKGHFYKITQNRILRWITSVAVLFYVLIPSIGTCHCSCCNHTNQTSAQVSNNIEISHISETPKSETTATCCCSENKPINESTTVSLSNELPLKNCCQSKEKTREPDSCPCLKAVDVSPFMLEAAVSISPLMEELKSLSPYLFIFPVQPDSSFVLLGKLLGDSIFCLSVRLHLLLNVMRN